MDTAQTLLTGKRPPETIDVDATVLEATRKMNDGRVGAIIVMDAGEMVGIFSERDVLRRVVATGRDPSITPVEDVMTRRVIRVTTETELDDIRQLMDRWQIRHVPVYNRENGLVGVVSVRDLNAWQIGRDRAKLEYLTEYVYGRA